jgi:hypothetical protein
VPTHLASLTPGFLPLVNWTPVGSRFPLRTVGTAEMEPFPLRSLLN